MPGWHVTPKTIGWAVVPVPWGAVRTNRKLSFRPISEHHRDSLILIPLSTRIHI